MKGNITMTGYWPDSPDRNNDFNVIPSNSITMKRMNQPLVGISDTGDARIMHPGEEHQFDGNYVLEMPLNKMNGKITDPTVIQRLIDNHKQKYMRRGGSLRIYQGDTEPSTVAPMLPVTGVPYAYQTPVVGAPNQWLPLPNFGQANTYRADINNTNDNQAYTGYVNYNPDEFNRADGNVRSSFPMENLAVQLPQLTAVGSPNRATKYAKDFMTKYPNPDDWGDAADPNSPVTEDFLGGLLGIGKTKTNPYTGQSWGYYNRRTNWQNAKNDAIAEGLLAENPQGNRTRVEWLASFSPGELAILQQSRKYSGEVAPNKWAEGAQGLVSGLSGESKGDFPNLFPAQLTEEEADNADLLNALGMVSIPAEGIKGWVTEGSGRGWSGASPIDYTQGRDVVVDEGLTAIIDPTNLIGVGIGEQAVKGVKAAKPFIQAGTEIGTRGATKLLNKTGNFLESKAGLLSREAVPGYQAFSDIDPNITARAASTNTVGGAFDYRGRTYKDMYDAVLNSNLPDPQLKSLLNQTGANINYTSSTKADFLNDLKPLAEQDARFAAYPESVRQQVTDELLNNGTNWKNLDAQDRAMVLQKLESQHGVPSSVAPLADAPAKEIQTLPNYSGGDLPAGFQAQGARDFTGSVAPQDLPPTLTHTRGGSGNAVAPTNPMPRQFNSLEEAKTFFADHADKIGASSREKAAINDNLQAIYDNAKMSGMDDAQALWEVRNALDRSAFTRMNGVRSKSGFESITTMPKNAKQSAEIAAARNGYNNAQVKSLERNIELATEKLMAQEGISKEEAFRRAHAAGMIGDIGAAPAYGWTNSVSTGATPSVDDLVDNISKAYNLSRKDTKLLREGYNDIIGNLVDDPFGRNIDPAEGFLTAVDRSDNPFDVLTYASSYGYSLTDDGSKYQKAFGKFADVPGESKLGKFVGAVNDELRAGRRAARRDEFVTPLTREEFKGAIQKNKQGIVDLNASPQYRPSTEKPLVKESDVQQATSSLFAKSFENERKMLEYVTNNLDTYLTNGKAGDVITGAMSTSHNSYVVQMDYIMKAIKNPANAGKLEPVFLGFKPMNSYGYMSKAGAPQEEILKMINNKLNSFQKKTGVNLQFEDKFPYITENGQIMLPQWGIKKLTDAPVVAKKKYGGQVNYNTSFMGYLPIDYMKAYEL